MTCGSVPSSWRVLESCWPAWWKQVQRWITSVTVAGMIRLCTIVFLGVTSMDWEEARNKATLWMLRRGWKFKLAKKKGFEQSLFEHTLIQLDALLTLFPLLQRRETFGLSAEEARVLWLATLAHDVGKETDAWQAYILGQGPAITHCIPELARETLTDLVAEYGWEKDALPDAISGVLLHMKDCRTSTMVLGQAIAGHSMARWKMLAEITDAIDNLASANGLFAGLTSLERGILGPYLRATYHQVIFRGISTVLLHKAAIGAFGESGWHPLVHYPNGTIYVMGAWDNPAIPGRADILLHLTRAVKEAMGSEYAQNVVGRYRQSLIPKPDLFDYREVHEYLWVASSRVGAGMFRKKKVEERQEKLNRYMVALCQKQESRCNSPRECQKTGVCKRPQDLLQNAGLEYQSDRLSRAHPEMMVFYVFRTMFSDEVLKYQEFVLPPEVAERLDKAFLKRQEDEKVQEHYEKALKKEQKLILKALRETARVVYDRIFGNGAFAMLQKASYPNPAEAMAFAVDPFWALPYSRLIESDDDILVEFLPDDKRLELLINTLSKIADEVFSSLDEVNRPKRVEAEKVAQSFLPDLVHPTGQITFNLLVEEQMRAYGGTKPVARKAEGEHLCPICNRPFIGGTNARADFLNNPESHTNRAPSHGRPGAIVICDSCKFERFVQQQILKGKAAQTMVLMPRMNIGYRSGEILKSKALQLWDQMAALMSEENPDPYQRVSFSRTGEIARHLPEKGLEHFTPEELVQVFSCRTGSDKAKEYRHQLKMLLNESIGERLEQWNQYVETDFCSEDSFLDAVENLAIPDSTGLLKEIRAKAYKILPQMTVVCETPHLILIPIRNPIAVKVPGAGGKREKESEVNAAIRELFAMLIIALALDCSVAGIRDGEEFHFTGGEGIVRVPPVPALRQLVGREWIGLEQAQKWVKAIVAAAQIVSAAAYPERSNLYQILSSLTPGHILRRIEMKSESGYVSPAYFSHLETIKEVLL